jgi:hypothetical protein
MWRMGFRTGTATNQQPGTGNVSPRRQHHHDLTHVLRYGARGVRSPLDAI